MALRLKAEGHDVSMWIRDPEAERRGEGLIEKGHSLHLLPMMIADCTGSGALLDSYRNSGGRTFNGSQLQDKLEQDRSFASSIFKRYKLKEPKATEFTSWDEAKNFLAGNGDKTYVFKPEGKHSGSIPSYVSSNSDDMLFMLDHFKGLIGEHDIEFLLQEFIKGTCISTEIWASHGKILIPTNHTLERKQLMNGDIGPSGGCTGNAVWVCRETDCPLCEQVSKLAPFVEEHNYTGCLDVNSVVSTEGDIYALEFTPRFGYDAFPTLLYGLFDGNFGEFIGACCRGESPELPLKDGVAAGVRISTAPWPSGDSNAKSGAQVHHAESGLPLRGLRYSNLDGFYAYEVSLQEDTFITSGGYGTIGVAVGFGSDITEAFEEAYKMVDKIKLPEKQYRTDLEEVFKKDLTRLKRTAVLV